MNRPIYHNILNELENAKTRQNIDTYAHRKFQTEQKNNIPKIEHHISWRDIVNRHSFGTELQQHINIHRKNIKSSKDRYQNSITHDFEEYREHFYTPIDYNKDDIVILNDDSIALLNQTLEKDKDYNTISVRYTDHFTIYKKDIVVIIPKHKISPRLYNMLMGIVRNYRYLGGGNNYVYFKNSLGKQIRKKIYIFDDKEKVRINANKYVLISTYKKNYLS